MENKSMPTFKNEKEFVELNIKLKDPFEFIRLKEQVTKLKQMNSDKTIINIFVK